MWGFPKWFTKERGKYLKNPTKKIVWKKKKTNCKINKKDYIIIAKAYKRCAVVIAGVDDYVQEANWQLENKFYKK